MVEMMKVQPERNYFFPYFTKILLQEIVCFGNFDLKVQTKMVSVKDEDFLEECLISTRGREVGEQTSAQR